MYFLAFSQRTKTFKAISITETDKSFTEISS